MSSLDSRGLSGKIGKEEALEKSPLHPLQLELGGKMVPFAGHEMAVNFPLGILGEHKHTRRAVGLFDVSHMGQIRLYGLHRAEALEKLLPADVTSLPSGAMRYSQLTNDQGGIIDDLIVTNVGDYLLLVVNGANKANDIAHIEAAIPAGVTLEHRSNDALIALQGPGAASVMARMAPQTESLKFMTSRSLEVCGIDCCIFRSGYTGEDGFEISVVGTRADELARLLLRETNVEPIGLGARDSLRLEAGLCLHGHDIDETTTPIEAGLGWSIPKRRREEGGFPGDGIIQLELKTGSRRKRVGIQPKMRAPAREGVAILDSSGDGIGTITSGSFSPSTGRPIAMGYVDSPHFREGNLVGLSVRGKKLPAQIVNLPFVPTSYFRG